MIAFNNDGVLPVGIHDCDESEFQSALVDPFAESVTRRIIATGFTKLRRHAEAQGVAGIQWVDGSFVTTKTDPDDVDLVTFVDADDLNATLGTPAEAFIRAVLAGGPDCPAEYCCDTYLAAVAPPGHPDFDAFEEAYNYWRKWFGQMRTLLGPDGQPLPPRSKGILKMELGNPVPWQANALGGGTSV